VKPGEIQRQSAKFGNVLDANGLPPLISGGKSKKSNQYSGGSEFYGKDGSNLHESLDEIRSIDSFNAGTDDVNHERLANYTRDGIPPEVGEIKDWTLHCQEWPPQMDPMPRVIFVDQQGSTVGAARLSEMDSGGNDYKVGHIWINPRYQGRGYGLAFYSWLIEQGLTIHSDYDQTPGSQALRKKLATIYKVRMTSDDWSSGPLTDVSAAWGPDAGRIGLKASL
jgi:hypothetical protein